MDNKDFSNEKEDNLIDNKYIIIDKKGSGLTSIVFKVKPLNENSEKFLAAKVMKIWSEKKIKLKKKSPDDFYHNEIKIFNELKNQKKESQYLINLLANGEGEVKRENKKTSIHKYMILDYADRGCLYDYLYYPNEGLKEEYTKLIFYKILQGVKAFHDIKICNRDIKLDNILLDHNFNPKICDFGFAEINQEEVKGIVGTANYLAPEIFRSKYDGLKVDIFNLGILLLILLTASKDICTLRKNENAKKLYKKNYADFWSSVYKKKEEVSEKCKNLFFRMTSYNPINRPNIDQALSHEWFENIRKGEDIINLEKEIKKELENREEKVKIGNQLDIEYEGKYNCNSLVEEDRSVENTRIPDTFDLDAKPSFIAIDSFSNNFIKIKTDLCPAKMMNIIYYYIHNEFKDNCEFEKNKDGLKFYMNFEDYIVDREMINKSFEEFENSDNNNEIFGHNYSNMDDIDDDIISKNLIIQVKMFETLDGEYLLRFKKKYGDLSDYYQKIEKIFSLIKNKIK